MLEMRTTLIRYEGQGDRLAKSLPARTVARATADAERYRDGVCSRFERAMGEWSLELERELAGAPEPGKSPAKPLGEPGGEGTGEPGREGLDEPGKGRLDEPGCDALGKPQAQGRGSRLGGGCWRAGRHHGHPRALGLLERPEPAAVASVPGFPSLP